MLVVYDSLTGNIQRFVNKLDFKKVKIHNNLLIDDPFVLITYTIGFGEVPENVRDFLLSNHKHLKGVAASGNRNWGAYFCKAADLLSAQYNVPVIHKFELSGTKKDIDIFTQEVNNIV
ncbi:class Ib ribonucleoside-diphosphate reductase assembly flavoprotein NrdI [Paenibacillus medicaginis]|uniref:Protein NrdI n=1 Tax=Paenibacillus medicaginis TaxID=1470560 RepID=A0ABV5BUG5_9BACL